MRVDVVEEVMVKVMELVRVAVNVDVFETVAVKAVVDVGLLVAE